MNAIPQVGQMVTADGIEATVLSTRTMNGLLLITAGYEEGIDGVGSTLIIVRNEDGSEIVENDSEIVKSVTGCLMTFPATRGTEHVCPRCGERSGIHPAPMEMMDRLGWSATSVHHRPSMDKTLELLGGRS